MQQSILGLNNVNQIPSVKTKFTNFANLHSIDDCELLKRITEVSTTDLQTAKNQLILIAVEIFLQCLCSALLPPCAPPADDNCVPIATLTINCRGGCNVVKVCNMENRRQLVTMPALKYWLEGFIKALNLGEPLRRLCCEGLLPGIDGITITRPDAVQSFINHLMQPGGAVTRQTVFQHLAAIMKEMAAGVRQ
jgi:hypothetical protein